MKKNLFSFLLFLILVSATLLTLEGISFFAFTRAERKNGIDKYLQQSYNGYIDDIGQETNCSFSAASIGHPMLGFIMRRKEWVPSGCEGKGNNVGFDSKRDLPQKKSSDDFTVMILGGSVAQLFAVYGKAGIENYFENYLNKHFYPPEKKQFKIHVGAMGAWSQPNQFNVLAIYGDRIDGIISIDGYNEAHHLTFSRPFEHVPAAQMILAYSGKESYRFHFLNMAGRYRSWLSHSFFKHSYFLNALYKIQVAIIDRVVFGRDLIQEFSEGNAENLKLPLPESEKWVINQLKSYNRKMHLLAKISNIRSAQFLQPTRLYGKELTDEEKLRTEFISKEHYQMIEKAYQELHAEGLPVYSLTTLFGPIKQRMYSDHIHYYYENGSILGNELMTVAIGNQLEKTWKLKRKK